MTSLSKHYADFDVFLRRSRKEFEQRITSQFEPSSSISDFVTLKTLGTGSFGRVVLVKHKDQDDVHYAMKMMEKKHVVKTKQVQHTISEIRLMDAIKFDFIVSMRYFFKDNVYLFLVMPFVCGGEMFTHLRKLKRFDETMSKFYTAQVLLALEYMHYMGLVYRDLKPENILIDTNGYLLITDLGFCKKIDVQRTYTLCGTPEYLAPEIILNQGYNKSVDYWSLGVLIYEMAAGYPPFYAKDPMKIYEKIVSGRYVCPQLFSKPLKDIVFNILQVDRTKRYGILKNGTKDIKGHEWFKNLDWDQLFHKRIKPGFRPKVSAAGDTSNFENYENEPLRKGSHDEYAEEFVNFELK